MKNPLKLKENAKNEAYRYFDSKIRHLPRNPNGTFNELADGFHNNDVDAFRLHHPAHAAHAAGSS